jgi:hypothetical protein
MNKQTKFIILLFFFIFRQNISANSIVKNPTSQKIKYKRSNIKENIKQIFRSVIKKHPILTLISSAFSIGSISVFINNYHNKKLQEDSQAILTTTPLKRQQLNSLKNHKNLPKKSQIQDNTKEDEQSSKSMTITIGNHDNSPLVMFQPSVRRSSSLNQHQSSIDNEMPILNEKPSFNIDNASSVNSSSSRESIIKPIVDSLPHPIAAHQQQNFHVTSAPLNHNQEKPPNKKKVDPWAAIKTVIELKEYIKEAEAKKEDIDFIKTAVFNEELKEDFIKTVLNKELTHNHILVGSYREKDNDPYKFYYEFKEEFVGGEATMLNKKRRNNSCGLLSSKLSDVSAISPNLHKISQALKEIPSLQTIRNLYGIKLSYEDPDIKFFKSETPPNSHMTIVENFQGLFRDFVTNQEQQNFFKQYHKNNLKENLVNLFLEANDIIKINNNTDKQVEFLSKWIGCAYSSGLIKSLSVMETVLSVNDLFKKQLKIEKTDKIFKKNKDEKYEICESFSLYANNKIKDNGSNIPLKPQDIFMEFLNENQPYKESIEKIMDLLYKLFCFLQNNGNTTLEWLGKDDVNTKAFRFIIFIQRLNLLLIDNVTLERSLELLIEEIIPLMDILPLTEEVKAKIKTALTNNEIQPLSKAINESLKELLTQHNIDNNVKTIINLILNDKNNYFIQCANDNLKQDINQMFEDKYNEDTEFSAPFLKFLFELIEPKKHLIIIRHDEKMNKMDMQFNNLDVLEKNDNTFIICKIRDRPYHFNGLTLKKRWASQELDDKIRKHINI